MIENSSPIPLYHQVLVVLRQRIVEGMFSTEGQLPTEKQLEAEFGVSRISIRRAVDALVAEGLVERKAGRGTMLTGSGNTPDPMTTSLGPFENLLHMGYSTNVAVLEFDYEPACQRVARCLECEVGAEVQRSVRVRSYKGMPFSHLTTWVPGEIGRSFDRDMLAGGPILSLLERAGCRPERAKQCFTAGSADPRVARALDVPVAAPLLSILRVVRDQKGRPVEYLEALYRPDRYRYVSTLTRNAEADGPVWLTESEDRT